MNLFDTQTTHYDDPYADLQIGRDPDGGRAGASARDGPRRLDRDHRLGRSTARTPICAGACAWRATSPSASRSRTAARCTARRSRGSSRPPSTISEGIIGVAPDVSIAALRACWAVAEDSLAAQCSSFSLARALEIALEPEPERDQHEPRRPCGSAAVAPARRSDRARHHRRRGAGGNERERARVSGVAPEGAVRAFVRRDPADAVALSASAPRPSKC